jgi:hypothetical protein
MLYIIIIFEGSNAATFCSVRKVKTSSYSCRAKDSYAAKIKVFLQKRRWFWFVVVVVVVASAVAVVVV